MKDPSPSRGVPDSLTDMPQSQLSNAERASRAGKASAAARTPAERKASAGRAGKAGHTLVASARKVVARWETASDEEKRLARAVMREAGIRV